MHVDDNRMEQLLSTFVNLVCDSKVVIITFCDHFDIVSLEVG